MPLLFNDESTDVPSPNDELLAAFYSLKSNKAWLHLTKNIEHWKNQCLSEILKEDDKSTAKAKGEYTAYGRVLNSIEFFIIQLTGNPGEGPQLDPNPPPKYVNRDKTKSRRKTS